jgi:glycosyltransferase involved in cell wall biosynthesis
MPTGETTKNPKVSVVICAYNVAPYIGETLGSVVAQSYADYEAIVVNDGSTDETEQALEPFRDRIVYVRQDNRGPSGARNTGFRLARGRYLATLDGDDVWMPDYLEKMVGRLEADPEVDLIYPNAVFFGSPQWEGKLFQDLYPSSEPVTFEKLLKRECLVFTSSVFKRELIDQAGMFDESMRWCEDLDLWLRMARSGARFAFTKEPLVRYRRREASLSSDEVRMPRGLVTVYEKLLESPETTERERKLIAPLIAEQQAQINRALAKQMIAAGDFVGAAHHLGLANAHRRSVKLTLTAAALRVAPGLVAKLVGRRQRAEGDRQ